jgi:hypothetical protein
MEIGKTLLIAALAIALTVPALTTTTAKGKAT